MHEHPIDKIDRDHAYLVELMQKIDAACINPGAVSNCRQCDNGRRMVCQGNVDQLIRTFVEGTLKHHMIESAYMADTVPKAHRIAHAQAHLAIAEQLRAIRVQFSADGNTVTAIDGMDVAFDAIRTHIVEFDGPLEQYLRGSD